ncbi:MAG: hypothetical protein J5858_07285 [Lentisphaeria bacterium]|nr:hypothetical protein [Lentisphaeria bacterium]
MHFEIKRKNGALEKAVVQAADGCRVILKRSAVPIDAESICFYDEDFSAEAGDSGFFLMPSLYYCHDTMLTRFTNRADTEGVYPENDMPLYACSRNGKMILAIVEGMEMDYELVIGVKDGHYYLYPRFRLETGMDEDIVIRYYLLSGEDSTPGGMARFYRKYLLDHGMIRPMRERIKEQSILAESLMGPQTRVRMAWKPMPPEILEQDRNNPPPVHAAVTFDRFQDVIREFRKQGIDHAEFCLVGWNKGGHDGQYPDLLPVEEALGGEEALKHLTRCAKENGYLMGAHTNIYDSYSSAARWERSDMIHTQNGEVDKGGKWCGGQSYLICPKQAHEKLVTEDMDTLARLGFNGTHYFDVNSMIGPRPCYNPAHPLSRKEAAQWRIKSFEAARSRFGAVSSEGSLGFAMGSLDFALYAIFGKPDKPFPMLDEAVPFRQIVYHGIVHYNYSAKTVNAPLKDDPKLPLWALANGAQPMYYYYSKFRTDSPWGNNDLECGTDEQLRKGVAMIREGYENYKKLRDLQYLFIDDIQEPEKDILITRYEDGTVTVCNGSSGSYRYHGIAVNPLSLARLSPEGRVTAVLNGTQVPERKSKTEV